jgi:hypothetical protein
MQDRKSLYLLIFALTVVTIAFILISIWGYHFYFQQKKLKPFSGEQQTALVGKKTASQDSLQTILNSTVQQLNDANLADLNISPDDTELTVKLIEFNRLKNEIAAILKNKISSKELSASNEKITELQKSVDELRRKNEEVERENERLNKILNELVAEKKTSNNTNKSEKANTSSPGSLPLLVSHLRFTAFSIKEGKERITSRASETKKLTGSFQLNIKPNNTSTSIYVVVIEPNGTTILSSAGQAGTFETPSGSKFYSVLLHFDNKKDNKHRLHFSIESDNFQKGKYVMQIYHNGIMIGRLVRTLY